MELKDGEFAVRFARDIIETWVSEKKKPEPGKVSKIFREKAGVFSRWRGE